MSSRSASTSEDDPSAPGATRPGRRRRHADRQFGRPFATCRRCVGFLGLRLLRGHPPGPEAVQPRRHISGHASSRTTASTRRPRPRPPSPEPRPERRSPSSPTPARPLSATRAPGWYERRWPRGSLSKPCQALRRLWPRSSCPAWRRSVGASRVSCHVPGASARERLAAVSGEADRAVVLFESPHRLQRALDDLVAACGPERPVAVCRELTKLHEEVWRCSLGEAAKRSQAVKPRGEYVIVLGPSPAAEALCRSCEAAGTRSGRLQRPM